MKTSLRSMSHQLFEMSYEVETFTKVKPLGVVSSNIDKLTAQPIVGKQKVTMYVNEAGDTNLEIENMILGIDLSVNNKVLQDNQPPIHKTIIEGGLLIAYATNGNEISRTAVEPFNMAELASTSKHRNRT